MRDADIRAFLTELHEAGQHHDAQELDHSKKMLNLEPETAQFLNILIRSSRRTRLLEIGTSNGIIEKGKENLIKYLLLFCGTQVELAVWQAAPEELRAQTRAKSGHRQRKVAQPLPGR